MLKLQASYKACTSRVRAPMSQLTVGFVEAAVWTTKILGHISSSMSFASTTQREYEMTRKASAFGLCQFRNENKLLVVLVAAL